MIIEAPLPRKQKSYGPISDYSPTLAWHLSHTSQAIGLDPARVIKACDLGCGLGYTTQALLTAYPYTMIDAVDYHDILDSTVKSNPRIKFHRDLLVDAIQSGRLGSPDVTLLTNITNTHGFNHSNIASLAELVGSGILITHGDNYLLEKRWYFRSRFRGCNDEDEPLIVWKTSP